MRRKIILIVIVTATFCNFTSCSKNIKTEYADSECENAGIDDTYYYDFGDVETEEWIRKEKSLKLSNDTLVIGVQREYSDDVIESVNKKLQNLN